MCDRFKNRSSFFFQTHRQAILGVQEGYGGSNSLCGVFTAFINTLHMDDSGRRVFKGLSSCQQLNSTMPQTLDIDVEATISRTQAPCSALF